MTIFGAILPSDLESIFRDRGIEPDEEYTAAAGKDYGYVNAWELPDGHHLIAFGNNAETDYALADGADDLAKWLENSYLSGLDAIINKANVRGIDDIEAASEDAEGPFYIVETHHYYGPIEQSGFVVGDDGEPRRFETYENAQAWIEQEEEGVYYTGHNESGRPSYVIVSVTD